MAETVLRFGSNRRQLPLRIDVPGGRILISREPHGTVLVRLVADGGEVVIGPEPKDYLATVRIMHEVREEEPS